MNWSEDACTRFQQLLQTNDRLKLFFEYMIGPTGYPSEVFAGELSDLLYPVGSITMSGRPTPPSSKWLSCNGQVLLRAAYPDLFLAIGVYWGTDTINDFKVPNFSDRGPVGVSITRAIATLDGAAQLTLAAANIPSHTHPVSFKIPNRGADTAFDGPDDKGGGLDIGTFDSNPANGVTNNVTRYPVASLHPQLAAIAEENLGVGISATPFNNYHPVVAIPFYIRAFK